MTTCLFCGGECERTEDLTYYVECSSCGKYNYMYWDHANIWSDVDEKHVVAGYLFETNRGKQESKTIDLNIMDEIKRDGYWPLTTMQRLEKTLLHLHSLDRPMGYFFHISKSPPSVAYARDEVEMSGVFYAMVELGWLFRSPREECYKLTITGLTHAEELLRTNIDNKSVFVAMKFNDDLLAAHEEAIKPACLACGFRAQTSNDNEYNDGIMDEIITEIKRSKFVIVDFTYNNNGAYFEAGYAQGLGREIIRLCKRDWLEGLDENGSKNRLHFDIQHYNIILWDNHADLLKKLKARIRATIPEAILED